VATSVHAILFALLCYVIHNLISQSEGFATAVSLPVECVVMPTATGSGGYIIPKGTTLPKGSTFYAGTYFMTGTKLPDQIYPIQDAQHLTTYTQNASSLPISILPNTALSGPVAFADNYSLSTDIITTANIYMPFARCMPAVESKDRVVTNKIFLKNGSVIPKGTTFAIGGSIPVTGGGLTARQAVTLMTTTTADITLTQYMFSQTPIIFPSRFHPKTISAPAVDIPNFQQCYGA